MTKIIQFFCKKPMLVNILTIAVILGGIVAWNNTSKEELPDVTFNIVRVSSTYAGASAADIEFYVTAPIEAAIQGIDGVYRITSTSQFSQSSISVELAPFVTDIDAVLSEIQQQVASVSLPDDMLEKPRVRVFETAKKAILDIALYNESYPLLDTQSRKELQAIARGLDSQLMALPEVFEIRRSGYAAETIQINVDPKKIAQYEISLQTIGNEIERSHIRSPSGTLKSGKNEPVTVLSEQTTKADLDALSIQGGFRHLLVLVTYTLFKGV